jgi:phosphatidyl-myo-inositol alpha-mannosyltransferase
MTAAAPLRIAIVAPYDLSIPGGINNQIRAQAAGLRRLGHSVGVFGPASAPLTDAEQSLGGTVSVSFGGTESGLGIDPRAFAKITRMLREPYDVIHVHEPLTPLVPWIVLLRSPAPLVGTFHVYRENGHRFYANFGAILRPLARRLRARIAVSDAAKRTVEPHLPGDYEIVPNGIDVGRFATARDKPAVFAADRRYVLYVGRLEPRKGVETLVRAMPAVQRQASVRLIVAGEGPQRTALEELARRIHADVHFAGRIADLELPAYYRAADIVCSPALGGESFGVVLLEAMAAGKPIVASRIDGYEALVGPIGCARLVAPGDATALAHELGWLLESPARCHELGARGAAAARDFDGEAVARRLEVIYRRIQDAPVHTGSLRDRTP